MFPRHLHVLVLAAVCLLGRAAAAQKTVQLTLAGEASNPTLSGLPADGKPISAPLAQGVTLAIGCSAPLDCKKLLLPETAETKGVAIFNAATSTTASVRVPPNSRSRSFALTLTYDGKNLPSPVPFELTDAPVDRGGDGGVVSTDDPVPVNVLMRATCSNTVETDADFVVMLDGTVTARPSRMPSEDDAITVAVVGDERLLGRTSVRRKSAIRTVRVSSILGEGVTVNTTDLNRQSFSRVVCGVKKVSLDNFADGPAEVELSVLTEEGKEEKSTFDFNVAKTYTGAFALGAIRTTAASPTFAKVFNGQDTVVSVSADDDDRLLYVLTYTPFIWGRRDVMRRPSEWYQRFNPMVGVVLNDVPKNGIAGVTYDLLNLVYFTFGVHAARVNALDPNAKVSLGGSFANRAVDVPTVKRWTFKPFYGLSVDLQGALGLLKAAVTAPAQGGSD